MTLLTESPPTTWAPTPDRAPAEVAVPRQRIRGLRLRKVPSLSLVAQVVGGVAALAGVYMRFGLAVSLMVGGVALLALGTLHEAEII